LDSSVDACTNFYRHVCGGWDVAANVPDDRPSASWAQDLADRANDRALRELLLGQDPAPNAEVQRLRTFVHSCMAQGEEMEQTGKATLARWLALIDGIGTKDQLMSALAELHGHGIDAFFEYGGWPDAHDGRRYRADIHQGTLGLRAPWYSDKGAAAESLRQAYRAHVTRMLQLATPSSSRAEHDAAVVLGMETELAAVSLSLMDRFDPQVSEHPMTEAQLAALAPDIDWARYLRRVGHLSGQPLNVTSPKYLQKVDEVLSMAPLQNVRAYLRWRFLDTLGPALPEALATEHDRFGSLAAKRRPRFEECTLETVKAMGVELSREFSLRIIGTEARRRARAMVDRVQAQMVESARATSWLSPAAREATAVKLGALDVKLGFPDAWPTTGSFPLQESTFLDNVLAAKAFERQRVWARARAERHRESWEIMVYPNAAAGMAAARLTIPNGYPDQATNSTILTAALLTAPLFDADAPPEARYGTFGTLVGHEIVHVSENHAFDALGEAHDLWSAADVRAHEAQASCMVEQGDQFAVIDNAHLDGRLTLDENLADLGGVRQAYAAMARELGSRLRERGADGLTRAQRFFIAYAQRWCSADSPAYLRANIKADGHGPSRFRVNTPLSNMPEFARAFSCREGSPMTRPNSTRCTVW
jgi:endothelin-converting enzyme/putative endopeptidase